MKPLLALTAALLLAACGSGGPPPPDWKSDSADLIERYTKHALKGENTLAEKYFKEAVAATGGAGRVEETARLWLVHCAVRRAMLIADACAGYRELGPGSAADEAYYRYLTLAWDGLDAKLLPPQHARIPAGDAAARRAALHDIADPLARLIAASRVVERGEADPATLALAAETASERGWRQPLTVYLRLLRERTSDPAQRAAIEKRLRLVEESSAR